MTVADRIKERRIELNLSQTQLAKKAGYTDKTSISKIENAGNEISMKKIERIAKALYVTPAYLLGWEDNNDTYYLNEDTAKLAQELFADSNYRILFDAARDSRPEDIRMAANFLKRLKETNPDG